MSELSQLLREGPADSALAFRAADHIDILAKALLIAVQERDTFQKQCEARAIAMRDHADKIETDQVRRLREQLVTKNEHLNWIKGFAALMTPENWRDMQLRIERQAKTALSDEQQ